jgi:hypothetical protein
VAHKVGGVPEVAYAGAADVDPGDDAAFAAALAGLLPGEARASHARAARASSIGPASSTGAHFTPGTRWR